MHLVLLEWVYLTLPLLYSALALPSSPSSAPILVRLNSSSVVTGSLVTSLKIELEIAFAILFEISSMETEMVFEIIESPISRGEECIRI